MEGLNSEFLDKLEELENIWNTARKELELSTKDIRSELESVKKEKEELEGKYQEAQSKIDNIEGQLENTIEQMKSMSKATDKGIDAMQLLDVYLVLMEQVFESQVHTQLLIMLHGAKEKYSINELATAGGISGIKVRQAIFDLRNANVVDYDEEKDEITLKMRFME